MEYPYFKGLEADRYSFYRVPKALVKADLFQKMSGDAKLLYAVLLDRMSLSIKNGWQDKHGNAYIICTIEEVMDSIHCARQKAVKLLDELEQEFRLIERRRQGLGKPNLLYVKDLYAGLSQSNYWKYENHTSGSLKNELPGVLKSNGSNTEKINKTDSSETDLMRYNPFHYIRSEKDILKLVNTIIANTKGDGEKSGEDFWIKAERLLYCALIGYIWYEAPEEEQNFSTLLEFINASEAREDDEEFKNPVDELFEELEQKKPEHFAVRQYKKYKLAAGDICSK